MARPKKKSCVDDDIVGRAQLQMQRQIEIECEKLLLGRGQQGWRDNNNRQEERGGRIEWNMSGPGYCTWQKEQTEG
jgi:hypothetical protein